MIIFVVPNFTTFVYLCRAVPSTRFIAQLFGKEAFFAQLRFFKRGRTDTHKKFKTPRVLQSVPRGVNSVNICEQYQKNIFSLVIFR